MFSVEHEYGQTESGLVRLDTGELLAGHPAPKAQTTRRMKHRHMLFCVVSDTSTMCNDFTSYVRRELPFPYSHYCREVCPSRRVYGVAEALQRNRSEPIRLDTLRLIARMDRAPITKSVVRHDELETLHNVLNMKEPHVIFFTLPSEEFVKAVVGLGGTVVDLSFPGTAVGHAKRFLEQLPWNTGWQTGEPQVCGTYEGRWGKETAVVTYDEDERPGRTPGAPSTRTGYWVLDNPRVPVFPPDSWRPCPQEVRYPESADSGSESNS